MSKRARNDGPEPVAVYPPGDVDAFNRQEPLDVVEPGKYLSADVPQAIHKELGERDGWTLVDYTPPGAKQDSDKAEGSK
jgi:hypothetical protein